MKAEEGGGGGETDGRHKNHASCVDKTMIFLD